MTTIYLVRHAEPHNPDKILYGRRPRFRLSEAGQRQADALGRRLSTIAAARIYSSPLLRARQTAQALAVHQPAADGIHLRRGLLEVRTSLEGRPFVDLPPGFNYYEPPYSPDDESIEQQFIRMDRTLRGMIRDHPGARLVAVSHGDPIASLRAGYLRRPFLLREIRGSEYPELASVAVLIFDHAESWPTVTGF